MSYATAKKSPAQKLVASLLSVALTAVIVTSTVLGMTSGTRSGTSTDLALRAHTQVQAAL